MREVTFADWMIVDPRTGKQRRSRWKMTAAEAIALDPAATPAPGSEEVRMLPETDEEKAAASPGAWMRRGS